MSSTYVGAIDLNGNKPKLKLDWRAYFYSFVEVHGEPIKHDGRLLFHDGWTYGIDDYQGPEYPPPTDQKELQDLQGVYWRTQYGKLQSELITLERQIKSLTNWCGSRSLPLKQRIIYTDRNDKGAAVIKVGDAEDLDLHSLESRKDDLDHLLTEARNQLTQLTTREVQ